MTAGVVRVAMWSGPRNISTAMMRSWGNRADTVVVDEPLYAYYLNETGIDHPAAAEIIAEGEARWRVVVASLLAPLEPGKTVFFQKQMTLHLLSAVERDWILELKNCFLIRHPRDVITSYAAKRSDVELDDLGFLQQQELYRWVSERSPELPPILDARDVQNHPREMLIELCRRLGVGFDEAMLRWKPGPRETDGVWAPHWYESVEESTGFLPYREKTAEVPRALEEIYGACLEAYEEMFAARVWPEGMLKTED